MGVLLNHIFIEYISHAVKTMACKGKKRAVHVGRTNAHLHLHPRALVGQKMVSLTII